MNSRRDFLKAAAMLAAGGTVSGTFPASIQKAFAIDPAPGSSYLDAEHVVILMQENRSFDHTFGTLRGVRGFDDPRAMTLPNGNPVWLQSSAAGETFAPFRLDIKNSKATWMGSLPHGWVDQADARNDGKHDGWIDAKACSHKEYAHMPLTLGYYTREDIPFYYSLADAFTICDQNFCSSLTATEPNRLHLWTGTVRAEQSIDSKAHVLNEDMGYDLELDWKTFPERLEEAGVSWRIYQNEISLPTGLNEDEDAWLSNFDDNTLEYFVNYRVRFSRTRRRYLVAREASIAVEQKQLQSQPQPLSDADTKKMQSLQSELAQVQHELKTCTDEAFDSLPEHAKNVHNKAFTTNEGDPHYRELTSMKVQDGETEREMLVPKGDVLYQFREDVRAGKLPTVSWIVPPERFSDHPSSPWYGAWYLSETLDILTHDPEVWKKTIFILCYDENDGYFDHVPPFVPPQPGRADTGKVSSGIDSSVEYVPQKQEDEIREVYPPWKGRPGPIGLGFRVPLVIASPWSRGGYVCSQTFDHTSILQFLEKFVSHRNGLAIRENNISAWRRTVCGDLTSAFRAHAPKETAMPSSVQRDPFFASIYKAKFKPVPNNFKKLNADEIAEVRSNPRSSHMLPHQEHGVRPMCALPYELGAEGSLNADRKTFDIQFSAGRTMFGERSAGAPFRVYTSGRVRAQDGSSSKFETGRAWDYAVSAGDRILGQWKLEDFEDEAYHLCVSGPNGFFREFRGTASAPMLKVQLQPVFVAGAATGNLELQLANDSEHPLTIVVDDMAYGSKQRLIKLNAGGSPSGHTKLEINLASSSNWYDLRIHVKEEAALDYRYAGHIETGRESVSDPYLGSVKL
ncbi:phosphocholine-specific phospholipase C [Acidicapsa ligni]|uniref:phosphocholine-specific phospholipase C n=1 Tax=Acidicapsa ligni TaxID=542300 RepID=UPI0021DF472F|nr:phospholipase C, phosphocholine-specific [Acidicapsa ligni]